LQHQFLVSISLVPKAAAASPIDEDKTTDGGTTTTTTMSDNTSLNATTTIITPTIDLAEEPFAVAHYRAVSETMINETQQLQISLEGSTTITLPNSTETITTRDTGEGIITFFPGGVYHHLFGL
jgi:hypothetical protein